MAAFFWYQIAGGEDAWNESLSEHREKIIQERRPAFVTVLDAHSSPDSTWGREEYEKMAYSGPLYFDFDGESIDEVIPNFQKFLVKLQDTGVNLRSLRLYATGGRGFHIEVPQGVFMSKRPKDGVTALPYVYREMAMELVVETLDMRVYTGRRGRMWRTMGVERSNGKFKVPIHAEEALAMTPELYDELTAIKVVVEPTRDLPELAMGLAAMFVKAQSKVLDGLKRRSKGTVDLELLSKFKGQFPPTVERIMRGENVAPNAGFHKIAMQLAITANALGKSADDLVSASEGLCKTYSGDSSRYGSPRKRKEELRRMHEYTADNPCYSYSRGGIRSLVDVDTPTGDLDGVSAVAGVGTVAEEEEDLPEELANELTSAGAHLVEGLMITASGIHKRTAEGAKTISNIGFKNPSVLVDTEDGAVLGIEANLLCDSKPVGRKMVTQRDFLSKAGLSAVCSTYGGIFSGTDNQAGVVGLLLKRAAEKRGKVVYAVHREGLDLVQDPLVTDRVKKDVIWVHPDRVVTDNAEAEYVYKPGYGSNATFRADVHNAKALEANPDTEAWLKSLFRINSPSVVASMLGWHVSCFHRQFYHQAFQQFPLLHPNGTAGSGKTLTEMLMARMFYLTQDPTIRSAGQGTAMTLRVAMTGSASVPLILDEYKPAEMGSVRTDLLLQSFRLAYNQGIGASGGISKGTATSSFRDVTEYTFSTPLVFLAEAQEMQTAVVQRCVPVFFSKAEAAAGTEHFNIATSGQTNMSGLGRLLLKHAYRETVESRKAALEPLRDELRKAFPRNIHDRQVYNMAVVLAGINFLDSTLSTVFGDSLRDDIDMLRTAVYEHKEEINVVAMSEAAKVINDMSLMSRSENEDGEFSFREGSEYIVKDGYVEVAMREAFVKYFSWCKRKGFTPLYTSADSFIVAMGKFPPTVDKLCLNSPLKRSGQTRVFRFSLAKLVEEGVEEFKTKS